MNWDFAWLADPSAWVGLGVLILLELALGIDNLLFISLLAGRLPRNRRKEAFRVGMGLALLQRFVLLAAMAWLIELREPLFTALGRGFAVRDIILVVGGVFLLFKGSHNDKESPSAIARLSTFKITFNSAETAISKIKHTSAPELNTAPMPSLGFSCAVAADTAAPSSDAPHFLQKFPSLSAPHALHFFMIYPPR